jgi:GSH-dependent disulfide-bond oxidoreductase
MIDFYTAATGNGRRPALMLEECGMEYTTHKLDLSKGEGRTPEYLKINPIGAIPAIVDHDGGKDVTVAQSGAILIYLAEKTGRFLPRDAAPKALHLQWLMFALTDIAPTSSAIFYTSSKLQDKAAQALFEDRLIGFLGHADKRLGEVEFLAGEYGIADMALYPIVDGRRALIDAKGGDMTNLKRWADMVGGRSTIKRAMTVV